MTESVTIVVCVPVAPMWVVHVTMPAQVWWTMGTVTGSPT
jgi:hypothetical protein